MINRISWVGLRELEGLLDALPRNLRDEAVGVVESGAEAAAAAIRAAYPVRTGNLRKGVRVDRAKSLGLYGVRVMLRNRAPHAFIFERGTQARHTKLGANRGAMPPGRVFIPIAIRYRRRMYHNLGRLLVRHGLTVIETSRAA